MEKNKNKMIENIKCFICGKKATEEHHTKPKKEGGQHKVPLCSKHHIQIEQIKIAIQIMERERKVSVARFRQIIDGIKKMERYL